MQDENSLEFNNRIPLEELKSSVEAISKELAKVIVGQDDFVKLLIVGLLTDGHVLIEGVPGIAKTITSKLFAKSIDTEFNRIQFTPDLMPSDVLGTSILKADQSDFEFKKGPIFSNIVLIDEINRAPAKTQAALFEVMEEQQITMDGKEYKMSPPFMVIATQNPIEQEGTYALPEAQLDRFLFKLKIDYPNLEEEVEIMKLQHHRKSGLALDQIQTVMNVETLLKFRDQIHDIVVEDKIFDYIAEIVMQTRKHPHLLLGGSPRASLSILKVAKAFAAIQGRDFVTPEDVKSSLKPVLNHRIILSPEKEMEGTTPEQVIDLIQKSVEIPR
ncbi:AAA family ATPase [Psychroflexus lacisalsi]|jgi:MoxR-like ATPase|uniref:MoxR family ATPase n=1 Tax=Psychroflexus lacisalsi TaxID=503928 RepID=A0ABN1K909_9FLAO|nr:MoxR family ATPase [Psychroflexus lacisalsi]MBZ9619778.1 MoxR family ATPase [Psychroflexus lacisalsi]